MGENGFTTVDMLNNNCNDMSVDFVADDDDDDVEDVFNTSHVDESFALSSADFYSKSLNDIHTETIPQNALRPNIFAFKSDDLFFSVSISFNCRPRLFFRYDLSQCAQSICRKVFRAVSLPPFPLTTAPLFY